MVWMNISHASQKIGNRMTKCTSSSQNGKLITYLSIWQPSPLPTQTTRWWIIQPVEWPWWSPDSASAKFNMCEVHTYAHAQCLQDHVWWRVPGFKCAPCWCVQTVVQLWIISPFSSIFAHTHARQSQKIYMKNRECGGEETKWYGAP